MMFGGTTRRRFLQGTVSMAALLAGAPMALAQAKGGSLVYATPSGPGTLDPHNAGSTVEIEASFHLFESLVSADETYSPKLDLASDLAVDSDFKTYAFTLRRGVKFHNGKEMTSADVLASYQRYQKVSANASALADVDRFEAPDPYKFVIHLKKSAPLFLDVLKSTRFPFCILPAEDADKPARAAGTIGTGPFRLAEWVKDSHLVFERFDAYAPNAKAAGLDGVAGKKVVHIDRVRFRFIPEATSRVAGMQAGDVDITVDIPKELTGRLAGRPDVSVGEQFPNGMAFFVLNSSSGPTANPLIRKAIQALVNVDEIVASRGTVARRNPGMLYPSSPYYDPAIGKFYDLKNPTRAKDLLKQAGYRGEQIVLQTNSSYTTMRNSILVLAELMKEAGMNVQVDVVDWTTNSNNMQKGTGGWHVSTTNFVSPPLLGPQLWPPFFFSFGQVKNDQLLTESYDKLLNARDFDERRKTWLAIEQHAFEQAYFIKVADEGTLIAQKTKIKDVVPWLFMRFWGMSVA